MKQIVENQRQFFLSNATKNVKFRVAQLKKLESVFKQNETRLHEAIAKDFGKSSFENFTTELSIIYHEIKSAKRKIYDWTERKRVSNNLANFPGKSYIIPEPLGVSLIIGAWNYPFQLSIAPAVAAIAAGNTVILKPSELSVETSKVMVELINSTFDANYFHVIEGGVKETTELLNQRFDKIFFTGSTRVGKIVSAAAAKNLTPVTLELGGKSPTVVTKNANLKVAAKRIVWGKFLNAGQTCIAPDYLYVEESIKSQFLDELKKAIEQFDYSVENQNYTQIINDRNFERLESMIDEGKIFFGGQCNKENRTIAPTILDNVSWADKVMQEEIFGPILPVLSFTDLDAVIQKIKVGEKPLSAYLYSKNRKEQEKFLNEISFGGGAINDSLMHIANPELPFGGVGHSGTGNYHGEYGFRTFSHYKGVVIKKNWLDPSVRYSPNSSWKLKILKRLLG